MAGRKASSIILLAFFLVSSASAALDILKLLEKESELSSFSKYLKDTKLADDINSRNTITVLVVDNGGLDSLSGKSPDVVKKMLSAHVVLDFFDEKKLAQTAKESKAGTLTTLLQASGQAQGQQGFINVGLINEGELAFGSAVKDAKMDSLLVKSVVSQPYSISILQVTKLIDIPNLGSGAGAVSPNATSAKAPAASNDANAKAPAPAATAKADAKAPAAADAKKASPSADVKAPSADAKKTSPTADAKAPTPSASSSDDDKKTEAPSSSDDKATSPSGDDTKVSSTPVAGEAPAGEKAAAPTSHDAAAPAPAPSAASRVELAVGAGLVMGLATLLA